MASSTKKTNKIGSIHHDGIEYANNVCFKSGTPDEIIKNFLNKLTEQFTVEVARRMYITEQATAILQKEQINIVLAQALAKTTNTFLIKPEFQGVHEPVPRMSYSGLDRQVDFWIVYEGIIILLSFNNEVTSITSSRVGKKSASNWSGLVECLESVEYTGSLKDSNNYRIYKVALDIVAFFRKVDSMDADMDDYNMSSWKHRIYKTFKPRPNWSSCWKLNNGLAGPYEYSNAIELYPAVAFLAHFKAIHDEAKVFKGNRIDCLAVVENKKTRNRIAGDWVYFGYQKVSIEKPIVHLSW